MSVEIGEAITVIDSWRTRLYIAFVTARSCPGSRLDWFTISSDTKYKLILDRRFRACDEGVTWIRGHDTPEARALATTFALEAMAEAAEGVE